LSGRTAWSAAANRSMTFIVINALPVVSLATTALTYNEQDAPAPVTYQVLDAGLTVGASTRPLVSSSEPFLPLNLLQFTQRIPKTLLTSIRNLDECKPLPDGVRHRHPLRGRAMQVDPMLTPS
jgi:hypothetical protein